MSEDFTVATNSSTFCKMGELMAGFREGRPGREPVLRVIEDDALQYAADVLVLKYAQHPYGVDKAAIARSGLSGELLPIPGDHLLVPNPRGIVAHNLLFLGVDSLRGFGYRQIREFGRHALQLVLEELPDAGDVCLTLHGAGYGLDEVEAFEAEVAGVVDAITSGAAPRSLRFVTFIERDPKRAARVQQTLRSLLPDAGERRETVSHAGAQTAVDRLRGVGYDSQSRPYVFVAMPFAEDLTDYFHYGIAPVIRSRGLLCERADQEVFTGDILAWITERIKSATLVVADLSRANPNVYLEVGLAWGFGVPTLLLCGPDSTPLFDVAGQRILPYKSIRELENKLQQAIGKLTPAIR